jgi:hypothetical protein
MSSKIKIRPEGNGFDQTIVFRAAKREKTVRPSPLFFRFNI